MERTALPGDLAFAMKVAEKQFQQRAFAAAIGAEQGDDLAGIDGEIELFEDGNVAIGKAQICSSENVDAFIHNHSPG